MKYFCLLLILSIYSSKVLASDANTIYINQSKIQLSLAKKSIDPNIIKIYLAHNFVTPKYQLEIYSMEHIEDAAIYAEKIVIIGKVRNTSSVLIINKNTGAVIDSFWSGFASLSPNGRYIVSMLWESRNEKSKYGVPAGVSIIYDVTKSPLDNRTNSAKQQFIHSPPSLSHASQKAGIPVYPFGDFNQPEYGWVKDYSKNVAVLNRFYWYEDDAFIFATYPKNKITKIIDASYNEKLGKFDVKEHQLKLEDYQAAAALGSKGLSIRNIEKVGNHIKLTTPKAIIRLNK